MIQDLIDGLEIMQSHEEEGAIVSMAYMIMIPSVKTGDLSSGEKSTLESKGWKENPILDCYFYETVV